LTGRSRSYETGAHRFTFRHATEGKGGGKWKQGAWVTKEKTLPLRLQGQAVGARPYHKSQEVLEKKKKNIPGKKVNWGKGSGGSAHVLGVWVEPIKKTQLRKKKHQKRK